MSKESAQKFVTEDGIRLFAEADITHTKDGRSFIGSQVPAYMHERHIEQLEEEAATLRYQLGAGIFTDDTGGASRARLEKLDQKIAAMRDQKPKLTAKQKDRVAGLVKVLGEKVGEAYFTKTEMMRGDGRNYHEEARRMTEPCVVIPQEMRDLALVGNARMNKDGAISRTDAEALFSNYSRLIGSDPDCERLRRG